MIILSADTIFAIKMEMHEQKKHDPNVTIDCVLTEIKRNFDLPPDGTPEMVKQTMPRWHGSHTEFVAFVETMMLLAHRFYHDKGGAKAMFLAMDRSTKVLADRLYITWEYLETNVLNAKTLDLYINKVLLMRCVEIQRIEEVLHGDIDTFAQLSKNELLYRMKHAYLMSVMKAIVDSTYKKTGWEDYTRALTAHMIGLCTTFPDTSTRNVANKALIKMIDNQGTELISVSPLEIVENPILAKDQDVQDALKRWCLK